MKKSRVQGSWGGASQVPNSNKPKEPEKKIEDADAKSPVVVQDGLVYFPNTLSLDTQKWLIRLCMQVGRANDAEGEGFYYLDEKRKGMLVLNQGNRGRVIRPADDFTEEFRKLCVDYVHRAMELDQSLVAMDPNTVLVNFYNDKATFKWHKDSEDPELIQLKIGKPIVSFSVGLSADFHYKRSHADESCQTLRLNSGDVMLFGGPSRMIVHSVTIVPRTMPVSLMKEMTNGRLNITVRDIGRGWVDKSQFPAYRVIYDGEQNEVDGEV